MDDRFDATGARAPWRVLVALLGLAACNPAPGDGQTDSAGATTSAGEGATTTTGGDTPDPTGGDTTTTTGGDTTSTTGKDTTSPTTTGGGDTGGPIGEWVWHDVAGTICANGTPTGLGINRGTGDRLVIYMSGGSACLDENCSIGTPSMRKDGGFGPDELADCVAGACDGSVTFPAESIFNRASAVNPFADATFVFISNCAGDYYAGDNDHPFPSWTAQFHGSRNQSLFAAALAEAFPDTSRVILSGGSAGAVGAMLNYWQWVDAFPDTRVDLIPDSFAFVFDDGPEWHFELHNAQFPPGCPTCATDYRTFYEFNAGLAPGARIAVLDSEDNWTLDLVTGFQYTKGLEALQTLLADIPNLRYYVASGNVHILMQHPLDSDAIDVERDGEDSQYLSDFLARMQADDPAWASVSCLGP